MKNDKLSFIASIKHDYHNGHKDNKDAEGLRQSIKRTNSDIMCRHGWCYGHEYCDKLFHELDKALHSN